MTVSLLKDSTGPGFGSVRILPPIRLGSQTSNHQKNQREQVITQPTVQNKSAILAQPHLRSPALQIIFLIVCLASLLASAAAAAPILGNYPDTSLPLSTDTMVMPDAAPAGTLSINVSSSTDFEGTLTADRLSGVVRVTNAHPAGSYPVTLTAFGKNGSTATRTFTLTVTTPETCLPVTFRGAKVRTALYFPWRMALGDFDSDGNQDFVLADLESNQAVLFFGDGVGNFSEGSSLLLDEGFAGAVAVGDFNGDGRQDVAVTHKFSTSVSIFLNLSRGCTAPTTYSSGGEGLLVSIQVGDFNGDGKQDLAVGLDGSVSILLGNGRGKFGAPRIFSAGSATLSLVVGDFNRDGRQDIAATSYSDGIAVLIGDGQGNFAAPQFFSAPFPTSLALGDFNGDGVQDLAAGNSNFPGTVSILLGDGTGALGPATDFTVGFTEVTFVAVGDFNGDGLQDLAATSDSNTVSILLGDGAGNFAASIDFPLGSQPGEIALGDFNGNGLQDLAIPNGGSHFVSILTRDCL